MKTLPSETIVRTLPRRAFLRSTSGASLLWLGGLGGALDLLDPRRASAAPAAPPARAPFPELVLRGSAGDIGLAHGRALSRQIAHNVGFYRRWLEKAVVATSIEQVIGKRS